MNRIVDIRCDVICTKFLYTNNPISWNLFNKTVSLFRLNRSMADTAVYCAGTKCSSISQFDSKPASVETFCLCVYNVRTKLLCALMIHFHCFYNNEHEYAHKHIECRIIVVYRVFSQCLPAKYIWCFRYANVIFSYFSSTNVLIMRSINSSILMHKLINIMFEIRIEWIFV